MKSKNSIWSYLFTPFRYIAGTKSLVIGLGVMLLLALLGYWSDTHFCGVLDLKYGCWKTSSFYQHVLYQLISWFCVVGILYLASRIFSTSAVRLVDMAGTLAMARIPLFIGALWGFIPSVHLCELQSINLNDISALINVLKDNIVWIILTAMVTILVIIEYIVLMYNAYSVSGNIKGIKGGWTFTSGLLLSEILSFIIIYCVIQLILKP